ncbi:MAG: hypothetical protein IJH38_03455 [Clostridia bacterium]|nr:hypothetical protein [Clostridia bacterium]
MANWIRWWHLVEYRIFSLKEKPFLESMPLSYVSKSQRIPSPSKAFFYCLKYIRLAALCYSAFNGNPDALGYMVRFTRLNNNAFHILSIVSFRRKLPADWSIKPIASAAPNMAINTCLS